MAPDGTATVAEFASAGEAPPEEPVLGGAALTVCAVESAGKGRLGVVATVGASSGVVAADGGVVGASVEEWENPSGVAATVSPKMVSSSFPSLRIA